jgi:putative spermidine/putrescine transport system permease protein
MTAVERLALATSGVLAGMLAVFLLAPLAVTILVSFGSSPAFVLPAPAWTAKWYGLLIERDNLVASVLLSLQVALSATALSLVLGTMAAIALVRGRFPGHQAIATALISPLMLPSIVLGVSLLHYFRGFGLYDAQIALTLAHGVITLPYIVRTVYAGLSLFDFTLVDAARTLGYGYPEAIVRVLLPGLAPAFAAGGLFAFLASMDNYPISIFLVDARHKTLPIQILQYLDEQPDPTIAALAASMIMLTLLVMVVGDRLVGIRRMANL